MQAVLLDEDESGSGRPGTPDMNVGEVDRLALLMADTPLKKLRVKEKEADRAAEVRVGSSSGLQGGPPAARGPRAMGMHWATMCMHWAILRPRPQPSTETSRSTCPPLRLGDQWLSRALPPRSRATCG